ncbi:MAG: YdcF family protein [Lachnospiraceae bacterium]|nr:YdcF family protein [Lachnospiraceae bacterium]
MRRLLYRIRFLIGAFIIFIIGVIISLVCGSSFTFIPKGFGTYDGSNENVKAELADKNEDSLEITDYGVNSRGQFYISLKSVPGKHDTLKNVNVYLRTIDEETDINMLTFYVHKSGVITHEDFFGDYGGSKISNSLWCLYLIFVIIHFIRRYVTCMKENIYQYRNILFLGFIIYLSYALFVFSSGAIKGGGLIDQVLAYTDSMSTFATITFPIVVIMTIAVSASNIKLMKREGINWRNMLGIILGITLCLGVVVPQVIDYYVQNSTAIDVHNWTGIGRFIENFILLMSGSIITYIECILIATIIISIKASKHIPSKDMDYILILGCMINKDGTLTKLLKGRANRAIEYAHIQKKRSGKDIVFVPSGGQGSDEVMAEGDAIKNYLLSEGIDDSHILVENKSTNTDQNFALSYELIKEHYYKTHDKESKPNIAFSTTNYHVFRSGMLASSKGITAEGVGAKTVSYFWLNAFIREFIATLVAEKKVHILVICTLIAVDALSIIFTYISNVILSSPM